MPFFPLSEHLEPIPGAASLQWKDAFVRRYTALTDIALFRQYSLSFLRKSVRVNTLKISVKGLVSRLHNWQLTPVPWCKEGFWIEHCGSVKDAKEKRRDVGNLLEHALGYIYVQEAASMIPPLVLQPKPKEFVLDLCAAPGSKTTQIAAMMKNRGLIIANDIAAERLAALGINLQRCGVMNAAITSMQGHWLHGLNLDCDRILVDAPCSGTGTIRKSLKTLQIWNPDMVRRLAAQQCNLLGIAYGNLKPGRVMVYSTCTMEPEENEGVIDAFLQKHPDAKLGKIQLSGLRSSPPVEEFEGIRYSSEVQKCLRIWPQDNDTEGFFVAKILKKK